MPRREQMSWDGDPNYRWVKMYRGVRYRVTCEELGTAARTKEATLALANEWWRKKLLEIDGPAPQDDTEAFIEAALNGPPDDDSAAEAHAVADELMQGFTGVTTYKRAVEALRVGLSRPAKIPERSVAACGQNFLDLIRGTVRPRSFEEIHAFILSLNDSPLLKGQDDISVLDEALVERFYLRLRDGPLSPGRKKKHFSFLRRFISYLAERKVIPTPGNLYSRTLRFRVPPGRIKTHAPGEIRAALDRLKPRCKLFALLALNCGMTQVDMSELRKDMVDLTAGTLTRRRVKTGDIATVPTVTYRLWPETLALLQQLRSGDRELFLTNRAGGPLLHTRYENGRSRRTDGILQQWKRANPPIRLKSLRATAATLLESHEVYGRYVPHFLGHSPRDTAARHYAVPSQQLFDDALAWLRQQIFPG
jgi:integrase